MRYSSLDSALNAAELLNQRENRPYVVGPYRCGYCERHHVGRVQSPNRWIGLKILEWDDWLGERVSVQLYQENLGSVHQRRQAIKERGLAAYRKALRR